MLEWLRPPAAPSAEGPFTELDARRLGPIRRFFVRHPVVMDVVVSLWYGFPALLSALVLFAPDNPDHDPRKALWFAVFAVAGALVLLRRRREPVLTAGAITVLAVASLFATGETGGLEFALALAVYAVAAARRTWVAWLTAGGAVAVIVTASIELLQPGYIDASDRGVELTVSFGVLLMFVLVAIAIGVSVRGRRQHIADLIARANAMARDRDQQAALAVADERTRIARELHDVVAHSLTVMVALADGARASAASDPEASGRALDSLTEIGRSALADMRRVLGVLRDPDDEAPLEPEPDVGLDELVQRFRTAGLPVRILRSGAQDDLDTAARRAVWRIVQESLTNVLKYAPGSHRVVVSLVRRDERDARAGDWFDVRIVNHVHPEAAGAAPGATGSGRGIAGMRERAAAHGGTVTAGPTADGWQVHAALRLDRPSKEDQ